jgi:hypothetical protein
MAVYLLSYDVPDDGNEDVYSDLYAFLEGQKAMQVLQSVWLVPWGNESGAEALVEAVSQHVEKESRIIACEVSTAKRMRSWRNLKASDREAGDLLSGHARSL